MAAGGEDDEVKQRSKKKKARKDKWGQPILPSPAEEETQQHGDEEEEAAPAAAAAPVGGGGFGDGSYEPSKVVVSGMPYSTTEQEIRDLFEGVGAIVQLQLSRFPDTGNFRGLAFIQFETEEMTKISLEYDGYKMGNRFIKVERCRIDSNRKRKHEFSSEPKKVEGCLSAYVGNLSWDVTEDELRDCFSSSKISSIRFALDKNTGDFRGFCHIDFEDEESLEEALKMNQAQLHGRPMKISYAIHNRT